MRKYSKGINMASGCSSVTIDPHAWTCIRYEKLRTPKYAVLFYKCSEWRVTWIPQPRRWISYLVLKSCEELHRGKESFLQQKLRICTVIFASHRRCLVSCRFGDNKFELFGQQSRNNVYICFSDGRLVKDDTR